MENLKVEEEQNLIAPEAMGGGQTYGLSSRDGGTDAGALGILLQTTSAGVAIPEFQNASGGFPFLSPHSASKDLISSNPCYAIPSCWKH